MRQALFLAESIATPLAPPFATAIARTTLDQGSNVALWWLRLSLNFGRPDTLSARFV